MLANLLEVSAWLSSVGNRMDRRDREAPEVWVVGIDLSPLIGTFTSEQVGGVEEEADLMEALLVALRS